MKRVMEYLWPVIGLAAVVFSFYLLYKELRGLSAGDVIDALKAIPARHYALAAASTLLAYAALAWYDRIALLHLDRKLGWVFISLVSFTTYALSHNIGASVFSGAMVRYRAYSTKGLSAAEVGVLVALCSFTFALGTILLGGLVLVTLPDIVHRLYEIPVWAARAAGLAMLAFVCLYIIGALRHFAPLNIGGFHLVYPRPPIALRQLFAAPLELIGAAGIIYFALPEVGNPGFVIVLGVFLASFSAALLSHAPGGLGVLEFIFLTAMPGMSKADVVAALLVFRLFYLLIPLAFAVVMVVIFERERLKEALTARLHVGKR
jgi:glycosyltransferase 2 family protein